MLSEYHDAVYPGDLWSFLAFRMHLLRFLTDKVIADLPTNFAKKWIKEGY